MILESRESQHTTHYIKQFRLICLEWFGIYFSIFAGDQQRRPQNQ